MKVLDLLKAPGFGRNKPIKAKALMADTDTLSYYKDQNLTLISAKEPNAMDTFKTFLAEFN
jgi:hypothetical protein